MKIKVLKPLKLPCDICGKMSQPTSIYTSKITCANCFGEQIGRNDVRKCVHKDEMLPTWEIKKKDLIVYNGRTAIHAIVGIDRYVKLIRLAKIATEHLTKGEKTVDIGELQSPNQT